MAEGLEDSAAELIKEIGGTCDKRALAAKRPGAATQALVELAGGSSKLAVSKRHGLGRRALTKLAETGKEWLEEWRARELQAVAQQARMARELANRKMAQLRDDDEALGKVSLKDLAVSQAVFLDKIERLAGSPTAKVEVEHKFGLSDAREWLAKAREARGRVVGVAGDLKESARPKES